MNTFYWQETDKYCKYIIYKAHFCHWMENKKGNCDFLSDNSDFFLRIAWCRVIKSVLHDINSKLQDLNP